MSAEQVTKQLRRFGFTGCYIVKAAESPSRPVNPRRRVGPAPVPALQDHSAARRLRELKEREQ